MKPNYCLLIFLFTIISIEANNVEMVVASKSGLAMRKQGKATAKIIQQIPYEKSVSMISGSAGRSETILGLTGTWLQVEYNGQQGWVFGPLLRKHTEKYSYAILAGKAIKDDPEIENSESINVLFKRLKSGAFVEIERGASGGCQGELTLTVNGGIKSIGGKTPKLQCFNGIDLEVDFEAQKWHILSGRILVEGDTIGVNVCHSENCQEKSFKTKGIREMRITKVADGSKAVGTMDW